MKITSKGLQLDFFSVFFSGMSCGLCYCHEAEPNLEVISSNRYY